jgi:hypothetical protein
MERVIEMVHEKTTTVYVCDICENEYTTEGEAQQCELVPLTKCNFYDTGMDNKPMQFNDWEIGKNYMVRRLGSKGVQEGYIMMIVAEIIKYDHSHSLFPVFEDETGRRVCYDPYHMKVRRVSVFDY